MLASQISQEQILQRTRGWGFKSDFCQPEEGGQNEDILTI